MENCPNIRGHRRFSYADAHDDSLVIKPLGQETTPPESSRGSWLRIKFFDNDKTIKSNSVRRRTWQEYIAKGVISQLAVLYQGEYGVLVRIYGQQNGMYLAHHIRLLQKDTGTTVPAAEAAGTWLLNEKWCVG
jgi:hypothetical protein